MKVEIADIIKVATGLRVDWEETKEVYDLEDSDLEAYLGGISDMILGVTELLYSKGVVS